MTEKLVCPRREETGMESVSNYPKTDKWEIRKEVMSKSNISKNRECSYCGSMHPEDFLKRIEEGWEVGPTDKNYKAYIERIDDSYVDTTGLGLKSSFERGKFYFQHFNEEQKRKFIKLLNAKKIRIGVPGHFHNLPFFIKR